MPRTETHFKLEGSGTLKKRVPVNVDLDEVEQKIFDSLIKKCEVAVLEKINTEVSKRGYSSISNACMYASCENPYQEESTKILKWTASCWHSLYTYRKNVIEKKEDPLTLNEIMNKIPSIE